MPTWYDEEFYQQHERRVAELKKPLADQLDQMLVDMHKEVMDNGSSEALHEQADKFISKLLLCNDEKFAVKYLHVALSVYCLPVIPENLKTFNEFHKRFSSYIVDNAGQAKH